MDERGEQTPAYANYTTHERESQEESERYVVRGVDEVWIIIDRALRRVHGTFSHRETAQRFLENVLLAGSPGHTDPCIMITKPYAQPHESRQMGS